MLIDGINVGVKCNVCGKVHEDRFWGPDSANVFSARDGWYVDAKNDYHACPECCNIKTDAV